MVVLIINGTIFSSIIVIQPGTRTLYQNGVLITGGHVIVYMDWEKTRFPKGGEADDIIYCYSSYRPFCYARRYIRIPFMPQNAKIISVEKLTLQIWQELPLRFKQDLKAYAETYKNQYPKLRGKHFNSFGVFLKILHQIEKKFHFSEMENSDYYLFLNLFGHLSVIDYIRLGYLPKVKKGFKLNYRILKIKKINHFKLYLDCQENEVQNHYKTLEAIMDG